MTGERGAAVLTGHSRLSAPEISAKILLKKKACCIKRLTKASPVFFALLFCIFGNRGGLPFDVARYLLGLYKQRKSKKNAISEIPGTIFRKRNPNTVLPRHRHRQKPENVFLFIITLNDPAGSRQQLAAPPPAPATSMKDERRATSDQDELRKQGSGRPQAGGERCLRSANSPLGRRCAGENHVFVRLAWIPISVCCLLHHPHFCWLGVAEYM